MIYTVTLNPSIDYVVHMDSLIGGITNRTTGEEYYFGGKGINVSNVLSELELDSTALGFVAGFTGEALEKGVSKARIKTDFIHLKEGMTRINVKIKAGEETEINGQRTATRSSLQATCRTPCRTTFMSRFSPDSTGGMCASWWTPRSSCSSTP